MFRLDPGFYGDGAVLMFELFWCGAGQAGRMSICMQCSSAAKISMCGHTAYCGADAAKHRYFAGTAGIYLPAIDKIRIRMYFIG